MAVAKNIIVVAELTKQFREMNDDFMSVIKDESSKVNNDVINFNEIGADPAVLVNNAVYPIAVNTRADNGIPVSLFKLDTENTKISDDELQALPYDKKSSVMAQHRDALKVASIKLGIHSLAPTANTGNTPVLATTGAIVSGRRQLTIADLINFKTQCDALKIPLDKRNLVLCPDHVADLLLLDNSFRDRYNTIEAGKIIKMLYSFNIFENQNTPVYDGVTLNKKAFGAASSGTDRNASIFFSQHNAVKAMGSVNMYYRDAAMDPENRQSVIGFQMYYLVSPITLKGQGAIIAGV